MTVAVVYVVLSAANGVYPMELIVMIRKSDVFVILLLLGVGILSDIFHS